jgi:DNA-binding PadR family transcriptional regulator
MVIRKSGALVLSEFLKEPMKEQYGFGLMRATGVKSGVLYPLLDRLTQRGWIDAYDEDIDERAEGRPRRRLYRLTGLGERQARVAVEEFYRGLVPAPNWLINPGGA